MRKVWKDFLLAYGCIVGVAAIMVLVAYHGFKIFMPQSLTPVETIDLLTFLILAALPALLMKHCIFAPEVPLGGIWIRRLISLLTGGAWYSGLAVLFGIVQKDAPVWEKVLFVFTGVILSCVFGIPAYIAEDKRENEQMKKITAKLQEQEDE